MNFLRNRESVGWGFFIGLLVVFIPPGVWFAFAVTYNTEGPLPRIFLGLLTAALVSGILTWVVNDILHRRRIAAMEKQRKLRTRR